MWKASVNNPFVILLYHGVTRALHHGMENCSRKHLPADHFERQMECLATRYQVLALGELLAHRRNGGLPLKTVAVTFDDGFENNYTVAFPILKRFGIPATFFLSVGFIDSPRVFWQDKVEYLINETPRKQLELSTLKRSLPLGSLRQKAHALKELKAVLKTMPPDGIHQTVREFEEGCGVRLKYDYEDYRTLTWKQVNEMHGSGLCDFGSHTVDHTVLRTVSKAEKEHQIGVSKSVLEEALGSPIHLFAYPEGLESHFDEETVQVVQSFGFTSSCTAIFGLNSDQTSDHHLHRNMVGMTASFKECLGLFP